MLRKFRNHHQKSLDETHLAALFLFFLKFFLDFENYNIQENAQQKIDTMQRDASRRDVFGRGLKIFVARRGGFIINFEKSHFCQFSGIWSTQFNDYRKLLCRALQETQNSE